MTTIIHFDTEKRKRERLVGPEQSEKAALVPKARKQWGDPEKVFGAFRTAIIDTDYTNGIARLHPEDQVAVLRRVADMCTQFADRQQEHNDLFGTPDRPQLDKIKEVFKELGISEKPTLVDDVKRAVREVNHDPTMVVGMDEFGKPVRATCNCQLCVETRRDMELAKMQPGRTTRSGMTYVGELKDGKIEPTPAADKRQPLPTLAQLREQLAGMILRDVKPTPEKQMTATELFYMERERNAEAYRRERALMDLYLNPPIIRPLT